MNDNLERAVFGAQDLACAGDREEAAPERPRTPPDSEGMLGPGQNVLEGVNKRPANGLRTAAPRARITRRPTPGRTVPVGRSARLGTAVAGQPTAAVSRLAFCRATLNGTTLCRAALNGSTPWQGMFGRATFWQPVGAGQQAAVLPSAPVWLTAVWLTALGRVAVLGRTSERTARGRPAGIGRVAAIKRPIAPALLAVWPKLAVVRAAADRLAQAWRRQVAVRSLVAVS